VIEFQHAGPVARDFFYDNSPFAAIVGPFGSGKSTSSILRLKRHMHEQAPDSNGVRSTRWLVVRNTYKQLQDATLPTWRQWFPSNLYGVVDSQMRQRISGRLPDGTTLDAEVLFRPLDDPKEDLRSLLSLELTGAWLNECREIAFETAMAIMGRTKRWPAKINGGPSWSGIIADSNPWFAESEWHNAFVVKPRQGYKLFHQPSGMSAAAENMANLHPDYYRDMERDLAAEPDKLAVNCYSEFGALRSGQVVYKAYSDAVHCKEFSLVKGAPIRIGVDFGIRACAATFMHRTPIGEHLVVDELVAFDQDLPSFIDAIKRKLTNEYAGHPREWAVGDRAGSQRNLSGITAFQIAAARHFPMIPSATNELSVRLAAVNKLLTTMAPNGKPAFQLHPRCKWLREGFLHGYKFEQARGSSRIADVPGKSDWSHPHDSLQYVAMHSVGAVMAAHGGDGPSGDDFARACAARNRQASGFDPFKY
jgi:phage terminase large subunit